MQILMIIPAYNEEESIFNTIKTVDSYNRNAKSYTVDYIIINDGSKDTTEQILERNNINHISLIHNLGIGGAVQTGYKYAYENKYDVAIQFDGDGQHDINCVPRVVKPLQDDVADFCVGSRFIEGNKSSFQSTGARRIGIRIISFLIKSVCGKQFNDTTSGFRAANRKVIEYFALNYPREYPEPESLVNLVKLGYRVREVPVEMKEREGGESSIKAWKSIYYMINVCLSILLAGMKGGNSHV